jgi:hypothetical protein
MELGGGEIVWCVAPEDEIWMYGAIVPHIAEDEV